MVRGELAEEVEERATLLLQPFEQRAGEMHADGEEAPLIDSLEEWSIHLVQMLFEDRVEIADRLVEVDAEGEADGMVHPAKVWGRPPVR